MVILKPCPFCGSALTISRGHNPMGRCDTPGCWMRDRAIAVPLDDHHQAETWNRRPIQPDAFAAALRDDLVAEIAACQADAELGGDMSGDDAVSILGGLIERARALTGETDGQA